MSEDEILRTTCDNRRRALPAERGERTAKAPKRPPRLWMNREVWDGPAPVLGAYPVGFTAWAARVLGAARSDVLHICSGTLPRGEGWRVDVRLSARPDLCADGRALPFRDGAFRAVMIDPPYSAEYAEDLYGTEYPRPSHLLCEAARVCAPSGKIGMLHFLVPLPPPDTRFHSCHGITTGCGYRIRAFTVFQKGQPSLPL